MSDESTNVSAGMTHNTEILKMIYGGDGLGRLPDGRAVFVPYTLPGEQVQIKVTEEKRNYVRGTVSQIITPHPERSQPRCKHFGVCGGCHYQHMSYTQQLAVKREILIDQLQRIAGLSDPPVAETIPSPQQWHYRNQVQFHLDENGRPGFINAESTNILPIEECHLPEPAINPVWKNLEFDSNSGIDRVVLRCDTDDNLLLILESDNPEPIEFTTDAPISAVYAGPAGEIVLAGDDYIVMEVLGQIFRVSARSFFQVNTPMSAHMVEHVLSLLDLSGDECLVDAYCGVGLFSAFLAGKVRTLIGIETSPSACEDFVINLDRYDNVSLYEAPVEQVLPALPDKPDILLADPPRSGLNKAVIDAIRAQQPEQLVYVSCDPATMARDARRLYNAGYTLVQVTPFDLFPQTYHIESIGLWIPSEK